LSNTDWEKRFYFILHSFCFIVYPKPCVDISEAFFTGCNVWEISLCHSLSPFINWFDLLTGLDTTPESPMLSEDHFSRGCFKSHSVWLAKITFFTGGVQSVGPDTQRAVVRSLFLLLRMMPGHSAARLYSSLHFLTRLFNRVFVLCLHNNSITFANNQKWWCSHYNCCGVCGSFLSSRQFRCSIHLLLVTSVVVIVDCIEWYLVVAGGGSLDTLSSQN